MRRKQNILDLNHHEHVKLGHSIAHERPLFFCALRNRAKWWVGGPVEVVSSLDGATDDQVKATVIGHWPGFGRGCELQEDFARNQILVATNRGCTGTDKI